MVALNTADIYGRTVAPWNATQFGHTVPLIGSFFPHGEEIAARTAALQNVNPWVGFGTQPLAQTVYPQIPMGMQDAVTSQILAQAQAQAQVLAQLQALQQNARMGLFAQQLPFGRFPVVPQVYGGIPFGYPSILG